MIQPRYVSARNIADTCNVCICRIAGRALNSVKRTGEKRYWTWNGYRALSPILSSPTLSRKVVLRVIARTFLRLRDGSSIMVTLNFTRGRKTIRSLTQTLASARMSACTKSGGNKSHISVGRWTWIQVQQGVVLLSVTCTHWTQWPASHWFPAGDSTSQTEINRGAS